MPKFLSGLKAKVLSLFALGSVALADTLTMSDQGVVSGTFDLANVYKIGAAVFAALATIAVLTIAFRMVKKAG
ncbi:hypothetical protein [Campylobacter sp. RM15925]|uniref:hypothetical protein n=1 Tax=Campylobacter sp. RM15925 TaxID=1705724 RepID=UPI00147375CA|nr:hypothetical protein [Campylobacter sp. RM15925]